MNVEPEFLNVRETARLLDVHENTVRNFVKSGLLADARVPGTRFHRFRATDVERLRAQRGNAAPTLKGERLAVNPELVTANHLKNWRSQGSRDAQENLPELVRRLLVETPGITSISVRTGDGVALGGWDGLADSNGTAFLPAGRLGVEIGVEYPVKPKADSDYQNRAAITGARDHVFVFVTPHRWRDKEKWAEERRKERVFADVRVLDADDLEGWLKAAPAAHHWISEHLGLKPRNAETLEHWWRRLATSTRPNLPVDLFQAGRSTEAHQLRQRLADGPRLTTIQSEWRDDCLAFVFAALMSTTEDNTELFPVLIVTDPAVWDRVVKERGEATLIGIFDSPDVSAALDGGHHVISVVDRTTVARRAVDITLPRVERRAAAGAFETTGLDYREADRLAVYARRSLPAMRRSIALDSAFRRPDWTHDEVARVLAPLVLVGAWTTSEPDVQAIARLTGHDNSAIETAVRSVSAGDDPVFRRVGNTWMVVHPEEAFLLLGEALTPSVMRTWLDEARSILLEADPTLDLSPEDRLAAQMMGRTPDLSNAIKDGVATGIAVMGVLGSNTVLDGIDTIEAVITSTLKQWFATASQDQSGRTWRLLASRLPLLAEAAPEAFLEAVENDLIDKEPALLTLFREEDDGSILGSGSRHPSLLWALETVAWSDAHLVEAIRALARLVLLEPGGRSGNRPSSSMAAILCGWARNTGAEAGTRLQALDAALAVSEDVGWQLLCDLWPSNRGFMMPPASPGLRDNWKPATRSVSMAEWAAFAHVLVQRAIATADSHGDRLADLVEKLGPLAPADRESILELLTGKIENGTLDSNSQLVLWEGMQKVVAKHKRFPDAEWSMPTELLERLSALSDRLRPDHDPLRFAYLFDWHPDITGVDQRDYEAYGQRLSELRSEAIASLMREPDWPDSLADLTRRAPAPNQVGWALADVAEVEIALVVPWLGSEESPLREAAMHFARRRLASGDPAALRELLDLPSLIGEARKSFLRCVPPVGDFWQVLGEHDSETYWSTAPIDVVEPADAPQAMSQLVAHNRAWSAVTVASYALTQSDGTKGASEPIPFDNQDIIKLLNAVLKQGSRDNDVDTMTSHYLGTLLDFLVETDADEQAIAGFEFAFYRALEHQRTPVKLNEALASQPDLFVQLVKYAFRAKGEVRREKSEADSNLATQAWWVLRGWHGFPGRRSDGSLDSDLLKDWVVKARLQLSEADRADIGDEVIGEAFAYSPVGSDGAWPAEPIRDLIETLGSRELENGFVIGRLNSRGVTSRDMYEGGSQERTLADNYRVWTKETKALWPRTSRVLKSIAESYERDANRQDTEAELDADRM